MPKEKIWKEILHELSAQLSSESVNQWFSGLRLKNLDPERLIVETPNQFTSDWLNSHFREETGRAAGKVLGSTVQLAFVANPELKTEDRAAADRKSRGHSAPERTFRPSMLNPHYTFDNFVVGPSNQFAWAACRAVAERQAKNYNPLFIYGGVGLGKTHLLNAVGNLLYERNPKLKIIAIQAESFLNDMIQSIHEQKMTQFRRNYRKDCDVLLMDDIEIIAGKERTQEEFFYTFNYLYSAGKKIIITSDKFPKEMTTLEERLRSRFESGIIVDIQPPEFETRLAIIKNKTLKEHLQIPDEIAVYLAENIKSNIRKLEGSLVRLSALSSLSGSPINLEMAESILRAVQDDAEARMSPETVMKNVSAYFKIKVTDLKSPKRNRKYVVPRQIAMFLCRELCSLSYPEIGSAFGGRDHSTVIHSCRKIGVDKNSSFELKKHLESIKKQLNA